ncbi:uncharacterized protein LOC110022249, partial [Phalaenopsis equestris]|uniref:uncharacterized protein LOC110022249 n=1 Tax=Phalaenopsis equestris TaxID=78828 RepID=UPI0009E3E5EE
LFGCSWLPLPQEAAAAAPRERPILLAISQPFPVVVLRLLSRRRSRSASPFPSPLLSVVVAVPVAVPVTVPVTVPVAIPFVISLRRNKTAFHLAKQSLISGEFNPISSAILLAKTERDFWRSRNCFCAKFFSAIPHPTPYRRLVARVIEDDAEKWEGLSSVLSIRLLDVTVSNLAKLLRPHGSYQLNQIDSHEMIA